MNKKKIVSLIISILLIVMLIPTLAMGNDNIEKEKDIVTENLEVLTGTEKILYKTEFQGNTYEFVSGAGSWEEAKIAAEEAGGHLVTITSLEEQEFLNKVILENNLGDCDYYIGLYKDEDSSEWQWVTDESVIFENWNDTNTEEIKNKNAKILTKSTVFGKWSTGNDNVFEKNVGYVVELERDGESEIEESVQTYAMAETTAKNNDLDPEKSVDLINDQEQLFENEELMSSKALEQWLWPVPATRYISQKFGGNHKGIDIAANGNIDVVASRSGIVIACFPNSCNHVNQYHDSHSPACNYGMGNYIKIRHDDGSVAVYMHFKPNTFSVSLNQRVNMGGRLASMGSSGWSTGQHLHFQAMNINGGLINTNPESLGYVYEIEKPKPFRSNIDTPQQDNQINTSSFLLAGWGLNESGIDNMVYSVNSGPERNLERGQRADVSSSHPAYNDNNNLPGFHKNIHISELAYGSNTIIVRAYTPEGVKEIGRVGVLRTAEVDPPIISNVEIIDASPAGYTVRCNVWDESGIDRIQFPTWTDHNGQDDIVEHWNTDPRVSGTMNGDTVTFRVNDSDHNYEEGFYNTHIYAFDIYGNMNSGYGTGYKMENKGEAVAKASYNNHEYFLIDDTMTWNDALVKSTELGGHLVTITDEKEQEIVNSLLESGKRNFYWAGGNDVGSEGQWRWVTGEPFDYARWSGGSPDNWNDDENVLGCVKNYNGEWNDFLGRELGGGFILEKEPIVEGTTETVTYGNNKYQRFDLSLSWGEAKSYCEKLGGRLVVPESEEENEVIRKLIENGSKGYYWLGGSDAVLEGRWQGTDGRLLDYYNSWGEGQPDNNAGIEHYLSIAKNGRWNDLPIAFYDMGRMGFVCEFENSMLPVVKAEFGNSTYEFYKNTASWKEANRIAKESGGYLVTITSEDEQNFIKETIKNNQIADRNYYLGATDEEEEGNWKWVTGEPMKYTHWMPNEPNNVWGKQHYGVLDVFYNESYLWDDGFVSFGNGSEVGFILEKDKLQLGDVDSNGKIEAYDALLALQIATQKRTSTGKEIKAANVDGNPGVQAYDALRILQFATGKITGF